MKIKNTITGNEITTHHTNRKWAENYINQEILWLNEEQKEYYYTTLDFEIFK